MNLKNVFQQMPESNSYDDFNVKCQPKFLTSCFNSIYYKSCFIDLKKVVL